MNIGKERYKKITDDRQIHINVGSGKDLTIKNLAETIKNIVGFKGKIKFDIKMPDGTPRKLLDCSRIKKLNWKPRVKLADGLQVTYKDFIKYL